MLFIASEKSIIRKTEDMKSSVDFRIVSVQNCLKLKSSCFARLDGCGTLGYIKNQKVLARSASDTIETKFSVFTYFPRNTRENILYTSLTCIYNSSSSKFHFCTPSDRQGRISIFSI